MGSGRGDFLANMRWVRANEHAYDGQWVALRDGELQACGDRLDLISHEEALRDCLFVKCQVTQPR